MNMITKHSKSAFLSKAAKVVGKFKRDQSGLAALEFVIVAPFLLSLWLGFYTFVVVEEVSTRVSKAAAVAADIPSQYKSLDTASITQALNAADAMMHEKWRPGLQIEILGVEVDANQTASVVWGEGRGWQSPTPVGSAPQNFPANLLAVPGFYVQATAKLTHSPLFRSPVYVPWEEELINFEYTFNFAPRAVDSIPCDDCGTYSPR